MDVLAIGLTGALLFVGAGGPDEGRRLLKTTAVELSRTGVELETLLKRFSKVSIASGGRAPAELLNDAEILFLLGDHQRASLLLYQIVVGRDAPRWRHYPRAVYLLAESLYQLRQDAAARRYFERLVSLGAGPHLNDAVRRLIQIADRNQAWHGIDEQVAVLEKRGALPPDIAYIRAKSLLRQSRFDEAARVAASIARGHRLYWKARYLMGVAAVQRRRWEDAERIFFEVARDGQGDDEEETRAIRELAAMNRGRLLLEEGQVSEAIDAYQDIDRSSPRFEEALYEVTWTFVRAAEQAEDAERRNEEYRRALKALEILLLSEEENPVLSEARILLGNIYLKLGEHGRAADTFDEIVERYRPAWKALHNLRVSRPDPAMLVDELFGPKRNTGRVLPPMVAAWIDGRGSMRRAQAIAEDLTRSQEWLDETRALAEKLLNVASAEERVAFFPDLQEALGKALELRNRLTRLSAMLLDAEHALVAESMSDERRAELERLRAERQQIEPAYRALPERKEEYEERTEALRQRLLAAQQQAYRLRYQLDNMRAQMRALDVWMASHDVAPEVTRQVEDRIRQLNAVVDVLEEEQAALEREIGREREGTTLVSQEDAEARQVRRAYQDLLEREQALLDAAAEGLAADLRRDMAEVARQRERMAAYHSDLEAFRRRLESLVDRRTASLKAQVMQELGRIEEEEEQLRRAKETAGDVVASIGLGALDRVASEFRDVLLRADVGIVDVAWDLKEAQTGRINQRVAEQRHELQVLDREFSDVLEGP